MKKAALLIGAAILSVAAGSVRADVVAGWTFESSGLGSTTPNYLPGANTATTNFYAETGLLGGIASAYGLHVGAATYTSPAGNGSIKSLSSSLWAQGDYYEFVVPLSTLSDSFSAFSVSYDQNGSGTGPRTYFLEYSLDGSSFTKIGNDYALTASISWNTATANQATQLTYDLSGITQLNTASTLYFRIVDDSPTIAGAINGGNVGTGGTDRVDNFIVNATVAAVPEPATVALATIGGFAALFALRRKR